MKTAKKSVAAFFLDCPACGEGLENPASGSYLFPVNEITPAQLTCQCGEQVKAPKVLTGQGE